MAKRREFIVNLLMGIIGLGLPIKGNTSKDFNDQNQFLKPEIRRIRRYRRQSSNCFIATAAFGSELHPQVIKLKNFRDQCLMTNLFGRYFVSIYYKVSPPIAKIVEKNSFLRVTIQFFLKKF